ncbi:hypothetical protein [Fervidibacter sacchari]|uniref:hypothetical protein n=1 Tax=Candidatus Fervidibacter sacchari TaxID=1448929 RepID=UPI003898DEE8
MGGHRCRRPLKVGSGLNGLLRDGELVLESPSPQGRVGTMDEGGSGAGSPSRRPLKVGSGHGC